MLLNDRPVLLGDRSGVVGGEGENVRAGVGGRDAAGHALHIREHMVHVVALHLAQIMTGHPRTFRDLWHASQASGLVGLESVYPASFSSVIGSSLCTEDSAVSFLLLLGSLLTGRLCVKTDAVVIVENQNE